MADNKIRDYMTNNGRVPATITLQHHKPAGNEQEGQEMIELPVTVYGAVIGAPNMISENNLPAYDKAPFNLLETETEELTRDQLVKLFGNNWII